MPLKARKHHHKQAKFQAILQKMSTQTSKASGDFKSPKDENYYFNSGSSIDWMKAKRRLEGAFREADVWDLVDTPDGAVPIIPDGEDSAILSEVSLGITRPDYEVMVTQMADRYTEIVDNTFDNSSAIIEELPNAAMSSNSKLLKIAELQIKRDEDHAKLLQFTNTLEATYNTRLEQYEKLKEKFEAKKAKCIGVFRKRISPSALVIVNGDLYAGRFRTSWKKLNDFYKSTNAGREGRSTVIHLLQNEIWDGKDLQEHIDHMSNLHSQCVEYGIANTDDYKYDCLSNSILRCQACPKELRDVINHFSISPNQYTYAQLLESLQTKASVLKLNKQRNIQTQILKANDKYRYDQSNERINVVDNTRKKSNVSRITKDDGVANATRFVIATRPLYKQQRTHKTQLICDYCHKPGHTKDTCWAINPCELCGELGHPAWKCELARTIKEDGVHNSSYSSSSSSSSSSTPKEVKLRDNFKRKYPVKG